MSHLLKFSLCLAIATVPVGMPVGFSVSAEACHLKNGGSRCNRCQQIPNSCQCGAPMPVMAPMMAPTIVPQTITPTIVPQQTYQLRPQHITTMQPVTRTEVRREAQVVEVPVTVQRQVTVDEGSYQTVWVPKMVTKNVAETSVQRHVQYRSVPYQVTEQIPVTRTTYVPVQTTAYGLAPTYGVASAPVIVGGTSYPVVGSVPAGVVVDSHGHSHYGHSHQANSYSGSVNGSLAPQPEPTMVGSGTPVQSADSSWTKVPTKSAEAPKVQLQSYQTETAAAPVRRFPSAPSAATVWQSQSSMMR